MYKAILLAIDLAHDSSWKKAAPVAAALADQFGAALHVMTVAPHVRGSMVAQHFPANFEKNAAATSARELADVVAKIFPGRQVDMHVANGRVYRSIVDTAARHQCDLIVMASHRPELQDVLLGPNADHVLRNTKASVLIVRE
tara:strand:+ start:557 stop:982 length:426 start_codon:yes stop_codon:yes gene_type:complete